LAWDYTYSRPKDSVNNQDYYIKDLPAKAKGTIKYSLSNVPAGNYALEVYKTGYRCNDAHTSYIDLGRPSQLNKIQVDMIKKLNDGSPVSKEIVKIQTGIPFVKELDLRENDVYLLKFIKL
jgi:xylan 1,4-beta-xylosidase